MRPYLAELRKIQTIAQVVGWNPHRWGLDQHLRQGVLVADLFIAAVVVLTVVFWRIAAPWYFFPPFWLISVGFAGVLCIVVAAQSRDEERIRTQSRKK